MNLQLRWQETCQKLAIKENQALFETLCTRHGESHRHYHTLQHIEECFYYFDMVKDQAVMPEAIEMAIWFHDVVYDVKGVNNEQHSAEFATAALTELGVASEVVNEVERLILITDHLTIPVDIDAQIMADIDLAILGADPERFAEFDQQVRLEFSWAPRFWFRHRRKAILKHFFDQPIIYQTEVLRDLLERQARENLAKTIKSIAIKSS